MMAHVQLVNVNVHQSHVDAIFLDTPPIVRHALLVISDLLVQVNISADH
jgi:hypothetical protein